MNEAIFTLPDDRNLAFARYGPPTGQPVLYFHGTPSSRLEVRLLYGYGIDPELLLQETGLQLIAVDRPGMGLSTFNPAASLVSFADDVSALARHLGISSCPVVCWSGGGPYALAMAWRHPTLIKDVHILCGFSLQFTPDVLRKMLLNKWYFRSARYTPWLLQAAMNRLKTGTPKRLIPQWLTGMPGSDYVLFSKPQYLQAIAKNTLQEACRNGARGPVHEAALYFEDFGFKLSDITQPVHFWWGTEDASVVRIHTDAVAQQIKNSHMYIKEGEGHLSLYVRYFSEALKVIASTGK